MNIRPFKPDDAESCFRLRSNAIIQKFHHELTPRDVALAVNAYMPEDYIRMAKKMPFFIVEQNDTFVGFFNLKQKDLKTGEVPLIYIALDHLGKGIGSSCIEYIERWLSSNWKEVNTLIVETIVPQYNSGFYKKVGFKPIGGTFCELSGRSFKALRLTKALDNNNFKT